jgi:hypothetical protein
MDATLQAQIATYRAQLDTLIRRGEELRRAVIENPSDAFTVTATRVWQQDCGTTVNQLSGGSKAHWLARSFSQAFLLRSQIGQAVEQVAPEQILNRLLAVLELAVRSLSQTQEVSLTSEAMEAPVPRRFDFVHNPALRPVVEQAYNDSRRALERGDFDSSLRTSCGVIEAIVTDALEHKGLEALSKAGAPPGKIADWPFEVRLATAERAGLIRTGWVRLTTAARTYRDHNDPTAPLIATEQNARNAVQVLNVVMRDLDPGR